MFLEIPFISLFSTSSAKISEFGAGNVVLFQIKAFDISRYSLNVTAHSSFMQLRVIRRKNRIR